MKKYLPLIVITFLILAISLSGCIEENKPPIADFTNSATAIGIKFTDNSIDPDGKIVKWHWDFSDGNTSDEQNPVHEFVSGGYYDIYGRTYNVTLTVTDDEGSVNSITKKVLVLEYVPIGPIANFTYSPTESITNQTIILFNASISKTYSRNETYHWDFGDGINITETNITTTHKYESLGTYTVNMTVTDELGLSHYITKEITVS